MLPVSPATNVQHTWIVEHQLMLITMSEILTTTALLAIDAEIWNILETCPASCVHFITDTRALRVYPSLANYMGLKSMKHPLIGWSLTVGAVRQPLLRFFLTTVMNAAHVRYRDFDMMSDALLFAQTIDESLLNLSIEN